MSDEEDFKLVSFDDLEEEESEQEDYHHDPFSDDDPDGLDSVEWEERLGMDEEEIEKDPWDLN